MVPSYPSRRAAAGYDTNMNLPSAIAATLPAAALVGFVVTRAVRTYVVSVIESAGMTVDASTEQWALHTDLMGAAALSIGAGLACLTVWRSARVTGEAASAGRYAVALGSTAVGLIAGLCGSAFHAARAAIPSAIGADIQMAKPLITADALVIDGWAAGGVVVGVTIHLAVVTLRVLLSHE